MSDSPLEREAQPSVADMKREIRSTEKREAVELEHEAESITIAEKIEATRPAAAKQYGFFESQPNAAGEIEDDGWINNTWEVLGTAGEMFIENGAKFFQDVGDSFNHTQLGSALNARVAFNPAEEGALGSAAELGIGFQIPFTDVRLDLYNGREWQAFTNTILEEQGIDVDATSRSLMNLPDVDRPDSAAGMMAADMTRFVLATLIMRKMGMKPGANAGTAKTIAANTAAAGAAAVVIADPVGENLINVLTEHFPDYVPGVIQHLVSEEDDHVLLNRLKTGMGDAGMGLLIEPIVGIIRAVKNGVRAPTTRVKDVELDAELDEIIPPKREPIIGFHGTSKDFDKFKNSDDGGIYFASGEKNASYYANPNKTDNPGRVIRAELDIKNPLVVDFKGGKAGRREAIRRARAEGHDGVLMKNYMDPEAGGVQDQWVALDPSQIKQLDSVAPPKREPFDNLDVETFDDGGVMIRAPRAAARVGDDPMDMSLPTLSQEDAGVIELAARDDGTLRVINSAVEVESQGKGFGNRLYDAAIEQAAAQGKRLTSDDSISEAAGRVWDSIARRGGKIIDQRKTNPENIDVKVDADTGRTQYVSKDGTPVVTLEAAPGGTGGGNKLPVVRKPDGTADSNLPARPEDDPKLRLDNSAPPVSHLDRVGEYTRAIIGKVIANPQLSARALNAIKSGNLHEADELIGLNLDKYNLEEIADELMEDPNKLLNVINTIAKEFEGIIDDAIGGVQTNKMTEKLAYMMDGNVRDVVRVFDDMRSGSGMAARIYAASIVTRSQLKKAFELAEIAAKDGATEADDAAAFEAIQLYGLMMSMVKGAGGEAARAVQMMSRVKHALSHNVGDMDDVLTALSGGQEARKAYYAKFSKGRSQRNASHLATRGKWRKVQDLVLEVYINGLLSGISTLVINTGSVLLIKFPEDVLARYGAVGVGSVRNGVRRALGHEAVERVSIREANAAMMGYASGAGAAIRLPFITLGKEVKKKGWKQALADDDAELSSRLGTAYKTAFDGKARTDVGYQRVDVNRVGAISHGSGKVFRVGFFDDLKDRPMHVTYGTMINVLGNTIRAPSRTILSIDEAAKASSYRAELGAQAYRIAAREADVKKLKGKSLSAHMKKRQKELIEKPTRELNDKAIEHARQMTFQTQLERGTASRHIESFINRWPTLKFVVPFYRTPVNILKQSLLERTPIALVRKGQNNLLWQIKNGGPEADVAIMKVAFGGLAIAWAIEKAMSGKLTTSSQGTAGRRNTEDQSGVHEYSYIFDDGTSIQISRADPYGMIMSMAAEIAVGMQNYDADDPSWGQALMDMSTMALAATTSTMLDKTWFKGFSDLVEALQEPQKRAGYFLTELSTNALTPYSSMLRRRGMVNDDVNREAWTWWDDYRKDMPWNNRDEMVVKRDYLGFPTKPPTYWGGSATWSPIMAGELTDDPVKGEMARLAFDYQMPRKNLWGFGELSAEQYNRFLELRGQVRMRGRPSLHERLQMLMDSGKYNAEITSDLGRIQLIKNEIEKYDGMARDYMLRVENPELNEKKRKAEREAKLSIFNLPTAE